MRFFNWLRAQVQRQGPGSSKIGECAIRCAWCGGPILIYDPITLYTPRSEKEFTSGVAVQGEFEFVKHDDLGFRIPAHAVVYSRDPLQLVGCLRIGCAESGADRAGFWVLGPEGKGEVRRVKTAYEEILSGKGYVVVGDLSDPREATPLGKEDQMAATVRLRRS